MSFDMPQNSEKISLGALNVIIEVPVGGDL
jgi:hypothetical protein